MNKISRGKRFGSEDKYRLLRAQLCEGLESVSSADYSQFDISLVLLHLHGINNIKEHITKRKRKSNWPYCMTIVLINPIEK